MLQILKIWQVLLWIGLTVGFSGITYSSSAFERLDRFFNEEQTYFAEFHQVVLDEGLHLVEESTGLLWFARPGFFRWEYREPFVQTLVSDGKSIWIYDAELEQTTVNYWDDVVDRSAAQILVGFSDLEKENNVKDLGIQGKLAWVVITPKLEIEAQFLSMRMAFDEFSLKVVEFVDLLDNTTRLRLRDVVINSEFDDKTFQFDVPEGVDLIDARED